MEIPFFLSYMRACSLSSSTAAPLHHVHLRQNVAAIHLDARPSPAPTGELSKLQSLKTTYATISCWQHTSPTTPTPPQKAMPLNTGMCVSKTYENVICCLTCFGYRFPLLLHSSCYYRKHETEQLLAVGT